MPDIVTLTMNPALDITTSTGRVMPTSKIRCDAPRRDPGGGGVNVARVLQVLGRPATAVFPSGGHCGRALEDLVATEGVALRTVTIRGSTRESFTINEESTGLQYRFVLPGPVLTAIEQQSCLELLARVARDAVFVVAGGSLPPGVPVDFYQRVADLVAPLGARLIVDTSGPALRQLRRGIYLVKPSIRELREWVGQELPTRADQVAAARTLIGDGVCTVLALSLGADGALLVTADEEEHFPSVDVDVVSGVGAGDSMVAGITFGLSCGWALRDAMRYGIAAGAAMLRTPGTAPCLRSDVELFYSQLAGAGSAVPGAG
ncbi:MAG: 1-phosphofructokinase family hexose kinase [Rhodococcus sp. (in: high G+C Gram-positive bacteria)]|uniref:1-phosphofructokinase family hexose kinase n=1 Tax=Rhodococcus sp. TaxID=1831 RepID=UPI003BAFFD50